VPPVVLGFSPCFGGGGGPLITPRTRGDEEKGYCGGSGEQSFGTGKGGVTQGVGRYVRVWRCVDSRASAGAPGLAVGKSCGVDACERHRATTSHKCQKSINSNCRLSARWAAFISWA
jgi:hypothetical protein